LKNSITRLESLLAAQNSANAIRFTQIEARLEEHTSKLAEVPSTTQIVAAMEQLRAIWCWFNPRARNRKTSLTLRMDTLFCGNLVPPLPREGPFCRRLSSALRCL